MDYLSLIKTPISSELDDFVLLFNKSLSHSDGLLHHALEHIRSRAGKRMRPMLMLLIAKTFGDVTSVTQHAAVGLELLHTASLVHDDVVDESNERRGQASVNAAFDNKVAVLVGDYVLSTALLHVSYTYNQEIVTCLAELGRTLSNGEILQLTNINSMDFSEDVYYNVIRQKTAALFEACAGIGAMSVGADRKEVIEARKFGQNLGMFFQIRDDIFDYFPNEAVGKPTGKDMAEGKLTLPVLYALNKTQDEEAAQLARRVRSAKASREEIESLVDFAKRNGGIDYAEERMWSLHAEAKLFTEQYAKDDSVRRGLQAYLDYIIERKL